MIDLKNLESKLKERDIVSLGRAITLNESTLEKDQFIIDSLLSRNKNVIDKSIVISISGIPGVGKSSFIEVFGCFLHSLGYSIAVFSIDPTSELSNGSILGDKTRMKELSRLDQVFIRPSPSSQILGGLGHNTFKNIELAKIAGFDVILIETVGVGQSETIVKHLSDVFVLLQMPSSGDDLQGIKKGIMELADFFIIHKADGDLKLVAERDKKDMSSALYMTRNENMDDRIFLFSSIEKNGIDQIWNSIFSYLKAEITDGRFQVTRLNQRTYWIKETYKSLLFQHYLKKHFTDLSELVESVQKGEYPSLSKYIARFQ